MMLFRKLTPPALPEPPPNTIISLKKSGDLTRVVHEAFYVARSGRPGPVPIDLPKDILIAPAPYSEPSSQPHRSYQPRTEPNPKAIAEAIALLKRAERPIIYSGGGIINAGPKAAQLLIEFTRLTGFPITSTLMGLGAYPASDPQFLGMLGMYGTYESNLAMHGADVMLNIGARFDDRVTGRIKAFSPGSKKIHADIDPSSINKSVAVDVAIVGDAAATLRALIKAWRADEIRYNRERLAQWWQQIDVWRAKDCMRFTQARDPGSIIKPQYAINRLYKATRGQAKETFITTEVGQHQMWAAQHFKFENPNRWMTSGGLGTMGYGLPAAMGVQVAHPDALVIDIAGEASILMNIQEMGTLAQYRLSVKIFILNNQYMGMIRQWQELLHGNRYSESYSEALPDFVKLADSFHAVGLRASSIDDLDRVIAEMIAVDKPVIADICVDQKENVVPMIPSGAAHNEMLLGPQHEDNGGFSGKGVTDEGLVLV
jgi:acetolactate synthase-1/2/3 large subunit